MGYIHAALGYAKFSKFHYNYDYITQSNTCNQWVELKMKLYIVLFVSVI